MFDERAKDTGVDDRLARAIRPDGIHDMGGITD